jgi:hypothetical protein
VWTPSRQSCETSRKRPPNEHPPPQRDSHLLEPRRGVNLRRTLPIAVACVALFGASFAAGDAILDGHDGPRARPTRDAPSVKSTQPAQPPRLALALGPAARLPGLRTPPRRAKRELASATAPTGLAPAPQPRRSTEPSANTAPAIPSPPSQTQPVAIEPPPVQPTPPPPTTQSSASSSSLPTPDAAPSSPSPGPDPAPGGGG